MKATKKAALVIDCCRVTGESRENSLKALHTNITEHKFFDGFEVSWVIQPLSKHRVSRNVGDLNQEIICDS